MGPTEEPWLLGPFPEEKASCQWPSVTWVMNAGDLSVGGEAGSPGVLSGGRKKNRNCTASLLPLL